MAKATLALRKVGILRGYDRNIDNPCFFWRGGDKKDNVLCSMDDSESDFCHLREIELAKQPASSTLKQALIFDRFGTERDVPPHNFVGTIDIHINYLNITTWWNNAILHLTTLSGNAGEALPSLPSEHDVISLAEVVNPEAREDCETLDSLVGDIWVFP